MIRTPALLVAAAALLPMGGGAARAQELSYVEAAMTAFTTCPPVVARGVELLDDGKLTQAGFERAPDAEAAKWARNGVKPVLYVNRIDGVPVRLLAFADQNCWIGIYGDQRILIRDAFYTSLDKGTLGYDRDASVPAQASPERRAYSKNYSAFTIRLTFETLAPQGEEPVVWIKASQVKD